MGYDEPTYRFDNIVDKFLCLVDLFFGISHDKTMQIFFLVAGVSRVRTPFAFFDGAFASDSNFGTRFGLHLLESIAARSDK